MRGWYGTHPCTYLFVQECMCTYSLYKVVFVFAFACSQCKIHTCLFLKGPKRVLFSFRAANVMMYIYFLNFRKGLLKFLFFTKERPACKQM